MSKRDDALPWSGLVLKHYWGADWPEISSDGKYPKPQRCTDEQITELNELQELVKADRTALLDQLVREMPQELDSVPEAKDLYERAEQLGHVDGFNEALSEVTALLNKAKEEL